MALRSRLDKECACALGFKGFKMPPSSLSGSKSGGGGGGGGGGGAATLSPPSPPIVLKERKRLVGRLLLCDVLCANVYVLFMIACNSSIRSVLKFAGVPFVFMFVAAQAKRMGHYHAYVVFHSLWHLGSALAIHLYFSQASGVSGASHRARAEKPVGGGYFW